MQLQLYSASTYDSEHTHVFIPNLAWKACVGLCTYRVEWRNLYGRLSYESYRYPGLRSVLEEINLWRKFGKLFERSLARVTWPVTVPSRGYGVSTSQKFEIRESRKLQLLRDAQSSFSDWLITVRVWARVTIGESVVFRVHLHRKYCTRLPRDIPWLRTLFTVEWITKSREKCPRKIPEYVVSPTAFE